MRFEGVFVAVVSPFTGSGELDFETYRRHLEWLSDANVDGFVPCGTTGEAPTLSRAEREVLIQEALQISKPKGQRVIAGCGSNDTRVAANHILEAAQLGCDAALVVTPYYNRPTPEGIKRHYLSLAESSRIPLLVYHVPARTGVSISVPSLLELLSHPNIIGIKEASGNHSFWLEMSMASVWKEKTWLAGDDDAFATTLALGGSGIISATANIVPNLFAEIYRRFRQGDVKRSFDLQRSIVGLVRAAFSETNPGPIKYALSRLRGMNNTLRLPLVPVNETATHTIDSALTKLGLI